MGVVGLGESIQGEGTLGLLLLLLLCMGRQVQGKRVPQDQGVEPLQVVLLLLLVVLVLLLLWKKVGRK